MVDYTSLATLHGEVFTEKNPAFVKVLNELGINMKDLQPLIEAIISESGKTHDILNNQTNHSLNELDKTVKLFEKKFRRYIFDLEQNGQGIHGSVTVDNLPDVQEVDGEVSINNLPDDYPDKNVKSELELIKQGIKDNKETNQLILDRLDGTIDTQVTRSNVEDGIKTKIIGSNTMLANASSVDILIPSGTMRLIYEGKSESTKINGGFRLVEQGNMADVRYFPDNDKGLITGEAMRISNEGKQQINFSFEVFTSHCRLYIQAGMDNDITLRNFNVIGLMGGKV